MGFKGSLPAQHSGVPHLDADAGGFICITAGRSNRLPPVALRAPDQTRHLFPGADQAEYPRCGRIGNRARRPGSPIHHIPRFRRPDIGHAAHAGLRRAVRTEIRAERHADRSRSGAGNLIRPVIHQHIPIAAHQRPESKRRLVGRRVRPKPDPGPQVAVCRGIRYFLSGGRDLPPGGVERAGVEIFQADRRTQRPHNIPLAIQKLDLVEPMPTAGKFVIILPNKAEAQLDRLSGQRPDIRCVSKRPVRQRLRRAGGKIDAAQRALDPDLVMPPAIGFFYACRRR